MGAAREAHLQEGTADEQRHRLRGAPVMLYEHENVDMGIGTPRRLEDYASDKHVQHMAQIGNMLTTLCK